MENLEDTHAEVHAVNKHHGFFIKHPQATANILLFQSNLII